MGEITKQILDEDKNHIRCAKCGKLLAKHLAQGHFEIKCPRCDEINGAFDQVDKQMIITDPDGKILYINKAVEKSSGYRAEEVVGKKPSELWGRQMPSDFYQEMWLAIKEEKRTLQTSVTNKHKTGKLYEVNLTVSPVVDADGLVMFYVGVETAAPNITLK